MAKDYDYGQLLDDFELGADVMPGESLTDYIERRRREFESKADGGSIGIEVLFQPKRGEYQTGGRTIDSRATAQDYANALRSVSAGSTYQQQADAKRYARNQASQMLNQARKSSPQARGIENIYNTFFKNQNVTGISPNTFGRAGSDPNALMYYRSADRDKILDAMSNQMLSTTSYGTPAPDPFKKQMDELEKIKAENQRIVNQYMQNNPPSMGIITGPKGGASPSPGKPLYEDKTLLSQLTKLTPLQSTYFDPFDQLSDIDQYNVAQAFPQLQSQLRNKNFVSSSGPLDKQQIFERIYGLKDGGRVGMLSGGALKAVGSGIMKLFGKGDDALDIVKQEEIFRSGDITTDFLEKVDPKVIDKFIRTRDTKGVGSYGMYDNFDDMPNGLKAAELISRIKTADGGINYEAAELFIGKKLKGDETVDELIKMVITEKKADGGRVGLFMGGPALEGQALNIYESMNAYGFTDQEIANQLSAQGLYTPNKTTTTTPVINKAPNIINQGDGDGGGGGNTITFSDPNFNLGPNKDVVDYEADAYGIGPTFKGQIAKAYMGLRSLPTPFNIASRAIGNISNFFEKKAAEKAAAEAAAAQTAFDQIMSSAKSQQDFYDSLNDGRGATSTAESRSTAGDAPGYSGPSPFAKGGLATMFTRRR
jgi:hypothetical protein